MPSRRVDVLCIMRAFYLHGQMKKTSFIGDDFFDLILNVSNIGL